MIPTEYVYMVKWDKELGLKLRKFREEKGLTRPQLAENLINNEHGCTEKRIKDLENGYAKNTQTDTLKAIFSQLDYCIQDLW